MAMATGTRASATVIIIHDGTANGGGSVAAPNRPRAASPDAEPNHLSCCRSTVDPRRNRTMAASTQRGRHRSCAIPPTSIRVWATDASAGTPVRVLELAEVAHGTRKQDRAQRLGGHGTRRQHARPGASAATAATRRETAAARTAAQQTAAERKSHVTQAPIVVALEACRRANVRLSSDQDWPRRLIVVARPMPRISQPIRFRGRLCRDDRADQAPARDDRGVRRDRPRVIAQRSGPA